MSWKAVGNKLVSQKYSCEFERGILEFVQSNGKTVVLLEFPKKSPFDNNNVYCVSEQGEVLWQIEGNDLPIPDAAGTYIQIIDVTEQVAKVATYDCHTYAIDMNTGKRLANEFTK